MKSAVIIIGLITLIRTPCFAESVGAPSCKIQQFNLCASETGELLRILDAGVDECFNPNHADAGQKTKQRLAILAGEIKTASVHWSTRDQSRLRNDLVILSRESKTFDDSPGFPASLYCRTNRQCLEAGFEGDPKYPLCQPVNGDIHKNHQYLAFEELLDNSLPALIKMLQQGIVN